MVGNNPEQMRTFAQHVGFSPGFQRLLTLLEIPVGGFPKMGFLCGELLLHPFLGLLPHLLEQIAEESCQTESRRRVGPRLGAKIPGQPGGKPFSARTQRDGVGGMKHHGDAARTDRFEQGRRKLRREQQQRSLRGLLQGFQKCIGRVRHQAVGITDHRHLAESFGRGAVDRSLQFADLVSQDAARLGTGFHGMKIGILLHSDGPTPQIKGGQLAREFLDSRSGCSGNQVSVAEAALGERLLQQAECLLSSKGHGSPP